MRQTKGLRNRIDRLEKRTGINKPPEIPVKDCMHFIEGTTEEEIQEKRDKITAEMVQKHGKNILHRLHFVEIHLVSTPQHQRDRREQMLREVTNTRDE